MCVLYISNSSSIHYLVNILFPQDYCAQTDRQDGLSGSIDASKGETGLFGGSIDGTVRRGDDKPPSLWGIIPTNTMRDLQLKSKPEPPRKGVYFKDILNTDQKW